MIKAIEPQQALEKLITSRQGRIKLLEGQLAKDSHGSSLPPSSDRFVRPHESLHQSSGKKFGGQKGHGRHHLRQVQTPDGFLIYPADQGEHCPHDLRLQIADSPEVAKNRCAGPCH